MSDTESGLAQKGSHAHWWTRVLKGRHFSEKLAYSSSPEIGTSISEASTRLPIFLHFLATFGGFIQQVAPPDSGVRMYYTHGVVFWRIRCQRRQASEFLFWTGTHLNKHKKTGTKPLGLGEAQSLISALDHDVSLSRALARTLIDCPCRVYESLIPISQCGLSL